MINLVSEAFAAENSLCTIQLREIIPEHDIRKRLSKRHTDSRDTQNKKMYEFIHYGNKLAGCSKHYGFSHHHNSIIKAIGDWN